MELKDILKDTKQFPDNAVMDIGGRTFTLGMLRTLSAADQSALSTKEAAIATKEAALNNAAEELKKAQATTAALYAEAQKQLDEAKGLKAAKPADTDDPIARLESDNILGPLVKYNKNLEAKLADAIKVQADLAKSMQLMSQSYLNDRLTDTYARVVPADKQGSVSIESLIKAGLDKGYKTPGGYVDIARAYNDIAAPDLAAAAAKAAEEAGYKRAMEEMQSKGIVIPIPTSGGTGNLVGADRASQRQPSQFKSLDDAFAAAAADTAVWREWNGLPAAN